MSTISQSRLRIAADLFNYESFTDVLRADVSGYIPKLRAGDAHRIELALLEGGTLLDVSNIASLTLEIKPIETQISETFDGEKESDVDLRGPSYDAGLLLAKTLAGDELYAGLTEMEWESEAPDKAHAVFILDAVDTLLAPGDRWLTISLLTTDAPALVRTVCAGRIRILGGGQSNGAPVADIPGETFYNSVEADARFMRKTGTVSLAVQLSQTAPYFDPATKTVVLTSPEGAAFGSYGLMNPDVVDFRRMHPSWPAA